MPCPIDGTIYVKIGDQDICPKCSHVAGYKKVDIVKILKENEQLKAENITLQDDRAFYKKMWLESSNSD